MKYLCKDGFELYEGDEVLWCDNIWTIHPGYMRNKQGDKVDIPDRILIYYRRTDGTENEERKLHRIIQTAKIIIAEMPRRDKWERAKAECLEEIVRRVK